MAAYEQRLGWQALGTQAGHTRLAWQDAVGCDRNADRGERLVKRRKRRIHSAPLFVQLHEPMEGLTSLRTLGGRV